MSLTAEPSSIERGQTVTLRWNATNADGAEITPGIGAVGANGTRQVTPNETITYTIVAKGPGGTSRATATVTVRPPAPPPPPPAPRGDFDSNLARSVQDAYFDYDKFDIRDDARATLSSDATALNNLLREFPNQRVTIEGHCDERGSAEYNLGLGDRRAQATREFLTGLGVPNARLNTVSYGKERPQCTESNESCWQRNRRAHFSAGGN